MTVSAPPSALKSTVSTSFVSIVMLPTSRKNRSRLPFADSVDALGDVGAVEEHRVGAGLALDGVAAVARIPDERVVAGTQERQVVAAVAVDRVVAVAAEQRLDAPAAGDRVVSGAAVEGQGDRLGRERRGRDRVVAAEAVDVELVGRLLVLDRHRSAPGRRRRRPRRRR